MTSLLFDQPGPVSTITLLPASAYRAMPWRNGLGTTTEIAVEPGADGRFRWRLSIADVPQSGPFSRFDGYDRVIAVVAGAGMHLAVAGRSSVRLDRDSAPYGFPGEASTECTLVDGPIRDFNLIFDRSTTKGVVASLHTGKAPVRISLDGGIVLLHAQVGGLTVDAGPAGAWTVPEGATLRLDRMIGAVMIAGEPAGRALLATIEPA
jgi:environmental stress-induced protein Ves